MNKIRRFFFFVYLCGIFLVLASLGIGGGGQHRLLRWQTPFVPGAWIKLAGISTVFAFQGMLTSRFSCLNPNQNCEQSPWTMCKQSYLSKQFLLTHLFDSILRIPVLAKMWQTYFVK